MGCNKADDIRKYKKDVVNVFTSFGYEYKKANTVNPKLTRAVYCKIASGFFKYLRDRYLAGHIVRLPERLGMMSIRGNKRIPRVNEYGTVKGLPIDFNATLKAKAIDPEARAIYHFNQETNFYIYRHHWYKKNMHVTNKMYYRFTPSRIARKLIAKKLKSGQEYLIN